ncbi:MAG: phosphate ABC transporter, permease protein PstA [Rickettsiales bacterium]|nr:phosphate ABC transporter, permease protein PstA [Rickettsiales bacterium]
MSKIEIIRNSLKKRHQRESVFKICGLAGIIIAIFFLITILLTIFLEGKKAFYSTYISLNINFNSNVIDPDDTKDEKVIKSANFKKIIDDSLLNYFPEVKKRKEMMKLQSFISSSEEQNLMELVLKNPKLIGTTQKVWLLSSSTVDVINKNREMEKIIESDRLIDDRQLEWLKTLRFNEDIKLDYNKNFFVNADSTEPEQAGIWGSVVGSFFTLLVTLILSFPVAVAAGVFLEELAPKNKFTDFIEVNINNLAAVPSIIFGLLGLAIFLNVMHLPRSAPIVGGITLGLMTLPTIIIATRSSLKAVPPSIREAAIGLGATKFQTVTHHVLPLSLPGISTGTIIGMSQALGESAPLLMIGMVAFIVDVPTSFLDSATVLPVQIYLWKSTAARGFVELTAAGVMVLLAFLILMNGFAVFIRKKFEKKW